MHGNTINDVLNQILNGDCLEVMKTLPDKMFDLILTDIPYNEVNRDSNGLRELDRGCADVIDISLDDLVNEMDRLCKGSMYIFCGIKQVSDLTTYLQEKDYSTRLLIWEKTNPSPMNGDNIWLSGIECCIYGKLKGATFNEHCKNTVLKFPLCSEKDRFHTTQKPLNLFKYLIQTSSNKGDVVLDCFSGSGTTAVACHELNRKFICIEKDKEYYKKSLERLKRVQIKRTLF